LNAANQEAAVNLLDYAGYRVVSLKAFVPFLRSDKFSLRSSKVKPAEIIMLYRQLALLLESGLDIVTALELLRVQMANRILKKVMQEIITDLRGGNSLSSAMSKHPKVFSKLALQSIKVGEQSGDIETILRQIADYTQKELNAAKGVKGALTYPIIAAVATVIVVIILVGFVLPTFGKLYDQMGAKLPKITLMLMSLSGIIRNYGLYMVGGIAIVAIAVSAYLRTEKGKYQLDKFILKLPLFGRVVHLKELARCCRSISLLFHAGLPLTEIMPLIIEGAKNKVVIEALTQVQQDMLKGEGLSKPMSKNPLFLPMMVQMVKVGEETGNLDTTILAVAESYEIEAKDKSDAVIAMIQPAMTVIIGGIIAVIALSMVSAMYSMYGQAF
jgi:type IV pilus assembly protein PilC